MTTAVETTDKTITILLVSDIHLSFTNIKKVGDKIKQESKNYSCELILNNTNRIDLVICPGDVCNFDPIYSEDINKVKECEKEMVDIYKSLQDIVEPTTKIIYLPGNHDSKTTLFGVPLPKLTKQSYNIHKDNYRLDEDLVLVGLGGSLPSYLDNKQHWTGYPYDNLNGDGEKLVYNDLNIALQKNNTISQKDKLILLTHMGPYNASTTIDQIDLKISPIYSGSKSIENLIKENQSSIILNIHGHTHHSTGLTKVGNTQIVNPGSLRAGRFVILTLEKFCGKLWRPKSTEFFKL